MHSERAQENKLTGTARANPGYIGIVTKVVDGTVGPGQIKELGPFYYMLDGTKDVWENDIELVDLNGLPPTPSFYV